MNPKLVVVFLSLMVFLFTFMLTINVIPPIAEGVALRYVYGADAVQKQKLHFTKTRPRVVVSNGDEWTRAETRRWESIDTTIVLLLGVVLLAGEWYIINVLTNGMLTDGVKEVIANASQDT